MSRPVVERDSSERLELEVDLLCSHNLEVHLLLSHCMKVGVRNAGNPWILHRHALQHRGYRVWL